MNDDIEVRSVLVIVRGLLHQAIKAIDDYLDPNGSRMPASENDHQDDQIGPPEARPE